jgi:ribosomal protein S18 acetylase RimI-like enzyme
MTITYYMPTHDDIPHIGTFGAETFIATFGHLYSKENADAFLEKVFSIKGVTQDYETPGMAYLLAKNDTGLVGYCKIGPYSMPHPTQGKAEELYQLYVREDVKGTGVAAHLMEWAVSTFRARQVAEIYLSVWSENFRAQRFYQRYGFKKVGAWDFMVGTQADLDYIYKLDLQ